MLCLRYAILLTVRFLFPSGVSGIMVASNFVPVKKYHIMLYVWKIHSYLLPCSFYGLFLLLTVVYAK